MLQGRTRVPTATKLGTGRWRQHLSEPHLKGGEAKPRASHVSGKEGRAPSSGARAAGPQGMWAGGVGAEKGAGGSRGGLPR